MADLVITASNVVPNTEAVVREGTADDVITAGKWVYKDAADNNYIKLADADTEAMSQVVGMAVTGSSPGQPVKYVESGDVTIGSGFTEGIFYALSATAGGTAPLGDLTTGQYVTYVGMTKSSTVFSIKVHATGAQVP